MATKIFVNLPVRDLDKSMAFFTSLGFSFNPQFTDDKAGCMVISDSIFAMLLTEAYFQTFTKKAVSDAKTATEVLMALDADSNIRRLVFPADCIPKIQIDIRDCGVTESVIFPDLDGVGRETKQRWQQFKARQ